MVMQHRPLLETPTRDALRGALVAAHRAVLPEWAGRETSPLYVADDTIAGFLLAQYGAFNASADRALVATATGTWLDALAAVYGVTRQSGESDADVRNAIAAAFASVSAGTPEALIAAAKAASPLVADVSLRNDLANNEIDVWLTAVPPADAPTNITPSAAVIAAVKAYLDDPVRRLILIDEHIVAAATVATYTVAGTVTFARTAPDPQTESLAQLSAFMLGARTLNTRIATSRLAAALVTPDVIDVDLTSPAADLAAAIDTARVGAAGTITFTRES